MDESKGRTKETVKSIESKLEHKESKETIQHDRIMSFIGRLQKLVDGSFLPNLSGSTLLTINDIGGQPGFLEMLPALSTGPTMYLVFLDLSKELDKPYKIPFSRDDMIITPYDAVHTVKSTISQILSAITSVHSFSHESSLVDTSKAAQFSEKFNNFQVIQPVTALIGTHKDKVQEPVEQNLAIINEALKEVTTNYSKIIVNPDCNKTFFAVDNFNGTEQSDIGQVRSFMNKIFCTHFN